MASTVRTPTATFATRRVACSASSRRRRAAVTRAAGEEAGTTASSGDDSAAGASSSSYDYGANYTPPLRRQTPMERVMKDPLSAAVLAPRVALGGLDLLGKGEIFGLVASQAGELGALLQDPRPVQDKAADAFRRAEEMVEMLEERGIAAEAPGRELVKPIIPAELYDRYLDPAATNPGTPSAAEPTSADFYASNLYTAEPLSTGTGTGTVEKPPPAPVSSSMSFDDSEDAIVAAAAAAVAAALATEEEEEEKDENAADATDVSAEKDGEAVAEAAASSPPPYVPPAPEPEPSPAASFRAPAFETPAVPADVWSAVEEAEKAAAEFVMGQSTATATKEAKRQ
jgi:hypothetical protein